MRKRPFLKFSRRIHTTLHWLVIVVAIVSATLPYQGAWAQSGTPSGQDQPETPTPTPTVQAASRVEENAQSLLESMTPEERVGQLFLVTFKGASASLDSEIYELINSYYVGGVILLAANDNFIDDGQTLENTVDLTRQLQTIRNETSTVERTNPTTGENFTPAYAPLLIGISQEGDGYPYDQILSGVTALPNQMTLGATWNADLAKQVGEILGKELSALGFNLLLGPSLDVLETPHTASANDLGTRTFGGDPFWVGKLGQAYIEGVHAGGNEQVAVIAKHFPGYGGSDRLPEDEVATVRKSLDQLLSFELTPFINVTGQAPSTAATADGLLTAHIRYQGFQGNIRATTRPVSFDSEALALLLGLPELSQWRQDGGVMVSDNLGSRAVRGFYDLTSQGFDMPRRVALNAFLAGNDILYIGDFSSGELDSISSARRTLEFFAQKYRDDPAFAQRVDESVLRILSLKFRLYGEFSLENVLAPSESSEAIGQSGQVTFDAARKAATLISPSQEELDDTIPNPPSQNERIVFVTDTRTGSQCSQCVEEPLLTKRGLEEIILRLYGPQAGGLVTPTNLTSYSLDDLQSMLEGPRGATLFELNLKRANWIVFSMLDASNREPSYQTLDRFLTERPDLFQTKNLIVFAFNAPYFLDATNISKLTAYYGLYSKQSEFVDTAAYLLFKELRPEGASPVSIPGVSYDLNIVLFPDPDQQIGVEIEQPASTESESGGTPEPTPPLVYKVGDILPLRTSVITDQNGHAVPDGTPVEFTFTLSGQNSPTRQMQTTRDGIARTTYTITETGTLEIQAISEPAQSQTLTIEIPAPNSGEIPTPTETPMPTETPTSTPTILPMVSEIIPLRPPTKPNIGDWIMALVVAAGIAWLVYKYLSNARNLRWGIRSGLLALVGGLAAYTYLALQLPGSEVVLEQSVPQGVLLATVGGTILGMLAAWSWYIIQKPSQERR